MKETKLTPDMIREIADQYEEQDRLNKAYVRSLRKEVIDIEQKIINLTQERKPYMLAYKAEYGDYREYVELVAAELRRRNHLS